MAFLLGERLSHSGTLHLGAKPGFVFEAALVILQDDLVEAPRVALAPESIAMPRRIGIDEDVSFAGRLLTFWCSCRSLVVLCDWELGPIALVWPFPVGWLELVACRLCKHGRYRICPFFMRISLQQRFGLCSTYMYSVLLQQKSDIVSSCNQ